MKGSRNRYAPRRLKLALTVLLAMAFVGVPVAAASGAAGIEGVWSFNGGQIAVQPEGNGSFEGIVVSPTTFAACTHPVGQKIWSQMAPQGDGSYHGLHQWYFEGSSCILNPQLGPTALRLIGEPNGGQYLRVCLSEPGKPQPTIPPGSAGSGSYGCVSSALVSPLPVVTAPSGGGGKGGGSVSVESLTFTSAKKCLSGRRFLIHIPNPAFDPFKTIVVTLGGKRLKITRSGRNVIATVNLRGLPRGTFSIHIRAVTVLGHKLSASRTYHTCRTKPLNRKPPRKKG